MSESDERDYRDTLTLPKTDFPDEGRASEARAGPDRVVAARARLRAAPRSQSQERSVDSARRAAVCQRRAAHGALPEHGAQGHVREDRVARRRSGQTSFPAGTCTDCRSNSRRSSTWASHDFHAVDPLELREQCKERALFWLGRQGNDTSTHGHVRPLRPSVSHDRPDRSKRRSSTRLPIWPRRSSSTRDCARRCGAGTTKRRWPKPRSSTSRRSRLRSTFAFPQTTRNANAILKAFGAQQSGKALDPHLDDDAVDAACERSDRAARRRDVWSLSSRRRIVDPCDRACAQGARRTFRRCRVARERSAANGSTAQTCVIRSSIAIRSSYWLTTSISRRVPARCTPRPDTAPTTLIPA